MGFDEPVPSFVTGGIDVFNAGHEFIPLLKKQQ
jgi:hypothetical protein